MAVFETTVNISTKNQRRGDVIQNKWVSKNTLINKGDLVVGTGASTGALITGDSYTDVANVNVISVGTDGYPLVANSSAAFGLAYQKVGMVGIADGAVTLAQINNSAYATTVDNFVQNPARLATGTSLMNIWDSTSGIHFAPNSQSMTVSAYINDGAVGTAQIANAAVGPGQIANMAVETKIGLETSFSTGSASVPVNITGKYGLYSVMVSDFWTNNDQYYVNTPRLLSFLFEYDSIMQAAIYKTYMSDSFSVLNYYLPIGYKIIKSAFTPYTYTPEYTDMIQLMIEPVNSSGSITGVQMSVYHVWIPSSPDTTTPSREQLAFQYRRLISFNQ